MLALRKVRCTFAFALGTLLSWLERYLDMVEVTGSSPVLPTNPEKPRTTVRGFFFKWVGKLGQGIVAIFSLASLWHEQDALFPS